ncbi:MAG: serine--tRNA ligase [Oscillospiraceae bacterium]|jgi:seryl-tRNA synthetase|nr:serine--tRNA ligase [Oscillospiraceae bacterium]
MIDLNFIRDNVEDAKLLFKKRACGVDVDEFLRLQSSLNSKKNEMDLLKFEQKKSGRDAAASIKYKVNELKKEVESLEAERDKLWLQMPNLLAFDTPEGKSDEENVELKRTGDFKRFDFQPQPHEVLGKKLGILDLERGAKVSGSGFYYLIGAGAELAFAVYSLSYEILRKKGFTFVIPPIFTSRRSFMGTGYFPFEPEQNYKVEGENLYAIGTSEQTLLAFHDSEILDVNDFPIKYAAVTPCFRTESGSYGKSSRGAFRVHQFNKMEQIIFCLPEDSENWHESCLENIEELMVALELPYRVVRVCVGDMGAPGYKKYDVEAWFPSFERFRETHSNTNLLDFQTRRLCIRSEFNGKKFFPHTISSTMITDRAVLAILENNQQSDGSIVIPGALRRFMGGKEKISVS